MSNEFNETPVIDPTIAASLFETSSDENFDDQNAMFNIPEAPVGSEKEKIDGDDYEGDINAETILDAIMSEDDNGHSPSVIVVALEKLHSVTDGMDLNDVSEDDHEYIDDITIEDCSVDVYTLDGLLFNLILKFDNAQSAYLKEINEMCNRYRAIQEDMAVNPNVEPDTVPMLSLTFMPHKLNGRGAMIVSFPVGFFRILDDDGVNCSFLSQYWGSNVVFSKIDMDDETRSEITADVLREMETGNGGRMFED